MSGAGGAGKHRSDRGRRRLGSINCQSEADKADNFNLAKQKWKALTVGQQQALRDRLAKCQFTTGRRARWEGDGKTQLQWELLPLDEKE